jgi:hypothetical protein
VIGAYPAVNQTTGMVFDSWHDYAKNIIYIDRSSNGGASWGTDVAAVTTHAGFGTDIGALVDVHKARRMHLKWDRVAVSIWSMRIRLRQVPPAASLIFC